MTRLPSCLAVLLALAAGAAAAEKAALVGATLHPIAAADVPGGTLLLEGRRITALGADVAVPADARVVDLAGLHVYPALVNGNTVLGLTEVGSVRGTVDVSETGDINPNVRAEVALNPDSEILPVTRANGVLAAMTAPRGGLVAGTAALVQLDGWTWEDMTIRAPVGLVVNWPDMHIDRQPDASYSEKEQVENRDARLRLLRDTFADARAYMQARAAEGKPGVPAHDRDPRWEAMLPVLRGEVPVLVAADDILQIRAALRWAEEERVKLAFISGGDIARVAGQLAEKRIPVVLAPAFAMPRRRWEPYDEPFTIAKRLHESGVRFCFSTGGASNARNLPYEAAQAVAYGLPHAAALSALTLDAAEILGAGDRLGSLAPGKDATFFACDGDPLDTRTQVRRVWIAGREVDIANRHTRLWEKYGARPFRAGPGPARGAE
jgi:imidazolonepropionase-like amidohydrolase